MVACQILVVPSIVLPCQLNQMLVCILSNIKYAVILCVFVRLCSVTDITATVTPIGIKFCTMVHICHGH